MNDQIKTLQDLTAYREPILYPSKSEMLGCVPFTLLLKGESIQVNWYWDIKASEDEVLNYFLKLASRTTKNMHRPCKGGLVLDYSNWRDAKLIIYLLAVNGDLELISLDKYSLMFYGELSDEVLNHYYGIQLDSELKIKSHIDNNSNLMIRLGNQELPEYLYQKVLTVVQESNERVQVVELQGSYHLQIKPLPLEEK